MAAYTTLQGHFWIFFFSLLCAFFLVPPLSLFRIRPHPRLHIFQAFPPSLLFLILHNIFFPSLNLSMDHATKGFKKPSVRLACSYLFDWTLCIVLIALFLMLDNLTPFKRQFSVEDSSLMYPYKEKETIPTWALIVIAVVFPAVVMAVVSLFIRRSSYDFHNGFLGLLLSVSLTVVITQVVKVIRDHQGLIEQLSVQKKYEKKGRGMDEGTNKSIS